MSNDVLCEFLFDTLTLIEAIYFNHKQIFKHTICVSFSGVMKL